MCVTWHLINSNVAKSVASAEVYTLSLYVLTAIFQVNLG